MLHFVLAFCCYPASNAWIFSVKYTYATHEHLHDQQEHFPLTVAAVVLLRKFIVSNLWTCAFHWLRKWREHSALFHEYNYHTTHPLMVDIFEIKKKEKNKSPLVLSIDLLNIYLIRTTINWQVAREQKKIERKWILKQRNWIDRVFFCYTIYWLEGEQICCAQVLRSAFSAKTQKRAHHLFGALCLCV